MRVLLLKSVILSLTALAVSQPLTADASIQLTAVKAILSDGNNAILTDNPTINALDAFGLIAGNDTGNAATLAATAALLQSNFGLTGWDLLGKSDDGSTFVSNVESPTGTLVLSNPPSPLDGPFAITLKASTNYAAFYFDATAVNVVGFLFDTSLADLVNPNNGKGRDLSHSSIFVPDTPVDPDGEPTVPEPTSLAVFSLLAMVGAAGYWRSNKA